MATIKPRGKSWYLNWSDAQGQHRVSLGVISERDAKLKLHAKEIELRTGQRVLPTGLVRQNFATEYLEWHATEFPSSYDRIAQIVEQYLLPFFGALPLDGIKSYDATQYTTKRLNGEIRLKEQPGRKKPVVPKRETITKELRTLKAILNKAVEWEYIQFNPLARFRGPKSIDSKPPRFYTLDELELIYQATPDKAHWWKFLANTGLRRGEAQHLRWKDVAGDGVRVLSTEEERTKSGKWREVPLSKGAAEALKAFSKKELYVFPSITPPSLSRAFTVTVGRSGIEVPLGSVHCLRHTFCSHLVMRGVPLRVVQKLAGHASFTTTERYAHIAPGHLRGGVEELEL